jgi:hypothetical protein
MVLSLKYVRASAGPSLPMRRVIVEVRSDFPVDVATLWDELSQIEHHNRWMADAQSIEFAGSQRTGVGTVFNCVTRIGPFVTHDLLAITEWEHMARIGVQHKGIVTGEGDFTLEAPSAGTSRLIWREQLRFPWWGLGSCGAWVARPVLRAVWRGNLRRLGEQLTARGSR